MTKKKLSGKKNHNILFLSYLGVFFAILLDQFTKQLAAVYLKGNMPFVLIPGVFELRYLENESAAFSMDPISILHRLFHFSYFDTHPTAFLTCKMVFFVVLTLAVAVLLIMIYARIPWNRHFLLLNLIDLCFLAGAFGNLIDRVMRHYVIDFFYFRLIDFPVFNVADIYVTTAAVGLILAMLFVYSDDDFRQIVPSGKKGGRAHEA